MSKNNAKVLMISRQLSPEYQTVLLSWVHLASTAENSARKSLETYAAPQGVSTLKSPEYSGRNSMQRSQE